MPTMTRISKKVDAASWQRGVFVMEATPSNIERAAAEAPIDDTFPKCLDTKTAQRHQRRRGEPHATEFPTKPFVDVPQCALADPHGGSTSPTRW
jgi:hypothetical protein